MKRVYNKSFFSDLLRKKLSYVDSLKTINNCFVDGQGEYRCDCWAYAGDILWCRDMYGRFYKINELVEKALSWYQQNKESSDYFYILSKLYMMLLMIHPFENANGRTIYTFVSFLAYSEHIIIQVPVLLGSDRIHESFRVIEHLTYNKIITKAISYTKNGKLKIDRRIHEGYNIGNYSYSSLLFILFEMSDNGIYDEMIDYFQSSIIDEEGQWIRYLK